MKISNSKRQLAQLLIEAGVTQFPEGANWAAQGGGEGRVGFCVDKQIREGLYWRTNSDSLIRIVEVSGKIPNWHQTVLSRDEFDQIVAESVVVSEPKVPSEKTKAALAEAAVPAPTLDQLLQDWRNADDYAQRKQTEADEAAAMRDEWWQAVQDRAGEMGVTVGRCELESELVITDWRDLQVGDIIEYVYGAIEGKIGMTGPVVEFAPDATDGMHVRLECDNGPNKGLRGWPSKWRFIRRP